MSRWKLFKDAFLGKELDYTKVNLKTAIFVLSVPMILEMMMESLFAVVDIFFVGKLGKEAAATVGLTEAVLMIVYSVGVGLSMAATAMIARRFGEKNYKEAGSAAFQLILLGGISSVIIAVLGFVFAEDILTLMGASEEVLKVGVPYTRIIFAGNLAIMLLFLINGAFRGAGQPHLAMRALWLSNGINIVLDPLLIFGLGAWDGLGLVGAAWATTIGRSIGVVYQLYHLLNGKHRLVILREHIIVKWSVIQRIVRISSAGMGQFLIDSVAWIVLIRLAAGFGDDAVAGLTITFRILMFTLMPAWGLSSSASTLVGQNLGGKKVRRATISVWLTARYNVIFLSGVTLLYLVFAHTIAGWFISDPNVIEIISTGLRVIVLGYVFFGVGMVMIQAFNGAGDTKTPMYINIVLFLLLEIPLAFLLAVFLKMGMLGIFITISFCHSLHAVVSIYYFRKGLWKKVEV
ncbi:MAG: MATE family efflux transporter [Cryomorphaceae bacterium]|nr:MATE family efflux transporter [Cryomorphaceae bacterium]